MTSFIMSDSRSENKKLDCMELTIDNIKCELLSELYKHFLLTTF